jgi:Domain of Unknown Function (DUF1080)
MAKYSKRFVLLAALGGATATAACAAGGLYLLSKSNEQWEPVPPIVAPAASPDMPPPADALVLFDGTDLSEWVASRDRGPAGWMVADGVVTVNKASGNVETRRTFRNFRLHLEWRVPANVTGEGQARGNSGVFLATTGAGDAGYEVQILDAWRNPTYVNGMAGAVYKQHAPLANPARPPGEWQSYDIAWTAPTFGADGALKSPARATVVFNGMLVQDNVVLAGETKFIGKPSYKVHGAAPIMLQAHADPSPPVSFRNIWLRETP